MGTSVIETGFPNEKCKAGGALATSIMLHFGTQPVCVVIYEAGRHEIEVVVSQSK
jgi:hypothetical protein